VPTDAEGRRSETDAPLTSDLEIRESRSASDHPGARRRFLAPSGEIHGLSERTGR